MPWVLAHMEFHSSKLSGWRGALLLIAAGLKCRARASAEIECSRRASDFFNAEYPAEITKIIRRRSDGPITGPALKFTFDSRALSRIHEGDRQPSGRHETLGPWAELIIFRRWSWPRRRSALINARIILNAAISPASRFCVTPAPDPGFAVR